LKKTLKEELEAISYVEKLDLLITYQDLLIESDKNNWQKRDRKQSMLRMRGSNDFSLSQTYYLLDHHHMSIIKDIYYSIGEELQIEQD